MISTANSLDRTSPPAEVDELVVSRSIVLRHWLQQRRAEIVAFLVRLDEEIEGLTLEIEGKRRPRSREIQGDKRPASIHQVFEQSGKDRPT